MLDEVRKAAVVFVGGLAAMVVQWINTGAFNTSEVATLLYTIGLTFLVWITKNAPAKP